MQLEVNHLGSSHLNSSSSRWSGYSPVIAMFNSIHRTVTKETYYVCMQLSLETIHAWSDKCQVTSVPHRPRAITISNLGESLIVFP